MASVQVAAGFLLVVGFVFFTVVSSSPAAFNEREIYDEVRQLLALNSQQDAVDEADNTRGFGIGAAGAGEDDDRKDVQSKPDIPKAVKNWPVKSLNLGQVSGVSVNSKDQPVLFHRADRVWDERSFNYTHYYQQAQLGPISEETVLTLDPKDGKVIGKWGSDMFYMPHGLTLDKHDNLWLTDVALHQAFKFRAGENNPSLIFGQRFTPGRDKYHLCKPTSIAVATSGEIFIADGYCNSRILKYNAAGVLLREIPNPPEFLPFLVPHALALIESMDRLCVADRENMRVTCPTAGLYGIEDKSEQPLTIQQPDMGRVFGVAAKGNLIYAVNGPTSQLFPVQGLTIDPQSESVIDHWAPEEGFGNPHAIAVSTNGSALYVVEIGPNRIWKFELVPPKK